MQECRDTCPVSLFSSPLSNLKHGELGPLVISSKMSHAGRERVVKPHKHPVQK